MQELVVCFVSVLTSILIITSHFCNTSAKELIDLH